MHTDGDNSGQAINRVAIAEPTKISADFLSPIRSILPEVINFDLA
jgi:hypothetical protein